jgi:DNA-binding XRE family transcriptional regulator
MNKTMKKTVFKDLVSEEKSSVHEIMSNRNANKTWLKKSMLLAIFILNELRERKITQVEFANKLGVSPQYVNKILKGQENLTLETIVKIEQILNITLITIETGKNSNSILTDNLTKER